MAKSKIVKIKVNLDIPIEVKGKYCGYCKFYDRWKRRCMLFDKELTNYVVDSSEWALPIIDEMERCDECIQAEVKDEKLALLS